MKKLKFLILIIAFAVIATGCDPDSDRHCTNNICFFDYEPTYILDGERIIDRGENLEVQVNISAVKGAKAYKVLTYSEGPGILSSTENLPANTPIPCKVGTGEIFNIPTDVKVGQKVFATVVVFSDTACKSSIIAKADTHKVTVTENSQQSAIIDEVFDYIGGESQYCNTDPNGNYNVSPSDNLFVKIAYSQVGYKEKKNKTYTENGKEVNALPKCTSKADGKASAGGWQKYSNSNMTWCAEFVAWSMKKAGIDVPFPVQTGQMRTWAQNNGRWYTDKSKRHEGDIVKYQSGNNGHVGILYKNSSGEWRLIHGNWNDEVVETSTSINSTLEGYISMKGITYN